MKELQGIFFDLDDTLYSCTKFAESARRNACKALVEAGVDYPEEDLYAELVSVIDEFSSNYDYHFDKVLLRIPQSSIEGLNRTVLIAAAVVAYHNTKVRELFPYEDALDLLQRLQKTDLVRGLISAGKPFKQAEKLVRLGLLKYLSHGAIFITEQVGITKANPRLFLLACERVKIEPEKTMYIGDNPLWDIDVPNDLGMITVHHKRQGKHAQKESRTQPDYVINNFYDLMDILQTEFDLPIFER
ncbi:MAG: HAD-IA family hydrolase [Planctomycetota bacterium]|nr:HAD-IA family hydrolase [Planctomycetota bacterium]